MPAASYQSSVTRLPRPGRARARGWSAARLAFLATLALLWAAPSLAQGQAATSNALKSINFVPMPGNRLRIVLTLAKPAPKPITFAVDNPARIALDLPGTRNELSKRSQQINTGVAESVNTAEAGGRTRVVVNLTELVPYHTRVKGNQVIIALDTTAGSAGQAASNGGAPGRANQGANGGGQQTRAFGAASRVTNVDFRRGDNGQGRVIVHLSNPNTLVNVTGRGNKTVVTFQDTQLPQKYVRRMDVTDFATPVKTVDARQKGDNAQLVITPTSAQYERLAYQADNTYTIEFSPPSKAQQKAQQKPKYSGKRISLNFQNVDVRAVLQILADVANINMVVSDNVKGTLALRLQNVPWDQALHIILQSKGLAQRTEGNVMFVAPADEIAAREKQQLQNQQQLDKLEPLESRFIQINYAKASDLARIIKSKQNSLLSSRGTVTVDKRTNTLLVRGTAHHLAQIRKLVNRLDIPVKQVLIESRIVVATSDFTHDLGVKFGATGVTSNGSQGIVTTSGSLNGTDTTINSALTSRQNTGQVSQVQFPSSSSDRLNVNLGANNPAGTLALAVLGKDYLLDLELSALQAEGKGEVISSPRVVTANQNKAVINQGVQIPYQQASSSGATSVSFKKAVLSLGVTPQITPDNRIVMDLDVKDDTVGQQVPSGNGGFIPSIDTREVQTQVLVNNGDTVVLGGIYEQNRTNQVNKVPLLGDIPVLGHLFREDRRENHKKELLVFITPKILKNGLTTAAENQ